ncbi:MAG TPA: SRPBCC domain-containing protein [Hyphomicrobiales bacterium]|nr:SRPBCC domain-containing protein [Hyphomicrobiales bacterium]
MNFLRSTPGEEPLVVEAMFRATPERVFRAWTEPEEVKAWFGSRKNQVTKAEIDLRVGGIWRFHLRSESDDDVFFEGEYFAIVPAQKLVFSWTHVVQSEGGARTESVASQVTVTFEPVGSATRVHLLHESLSSDGARLNVSRGWEASFTKLDALFSGEVKG